MSVIAWDGKYVAADKQATRNGLIRVCTKLFKYEFKYKEKEVLLGGIGSDESSHILMDWYRDGADPEKWPQCQKDKDNWSHLLVFDKNGARYSSLFPKFIKIENPFFAWGSGEDLAMGAMAAGADAIKATKITCEFNDGCGCGIDAYEIETMRKIK